MKVLRSELGSDRPKPGEMVAFQGLTSVLDHLTDRLALREQTCYQWAARVGAFPRLLERDRAVYLHGLHVATGRI